MVIGGSHDLTLAQYEACKANIWSSTATGIDARINPEGESQIRSENFLLDMLTSRPIWSGITATSHSRVILYTPACWKRWINCGSIASRVGVVKEHIEEMEPVIRQTNLLSFDVCAIKHSDAPANGESEWTDR